MIAGFLNLSFQSKKILVLEINKNPGAEAPGQAFDLYF
jgi:hypothetical protein